ncbi:MAG: tetratricopeptide repeat protein [Bacteroidales bacterium]|nr:tetratricopeptide repeat protein [Bacteroidales bacterium]
MKKWLFSFLLLWSAVHVFGQERKPVDYEYIHKLVLSHQFSEAENLIEYSGLKQTQKIYLDQLSRFMKINLTENESLLDTYNQRNKKHRELLSGLKSEDARFTEATLFIESMITRARFGEYAAAALEFNKAYHLIQNLNRNNPHYMPAQMMNGIMLILFGSIPDQYNWVIRILKIDGNVTEGLSILDKVFKHYLKVQGDQNMLAESILFLSFSYRNFYPGQKELNIIKSYFSRDVLKPYIKYSPFIRYAAASLYKDLGYNDKALEIISRPYPRKPEIPFYYLDYYMRGLAMLQKQDYNAIYYFRSYLNKYPGKLYKKAAAQKIAWIKLLKGNKQEYYAAIANVDNYDSQMNGADNAAQKEYISKEIPNKYLLKVRLLFDGGYYQKALNEILRQKDSKASLSQRDALEYTYRIARIYHKLNNLQKAKHYYQLTIRRGKDLPLYFAANASLHLGEIYFSKGEQDKAKEVFEECLDMNPDTYKSSIHQKAEAYLEQIG